MGGSGGRTFRVRDCGGDDPNGFKGAIFLSLSLFAIALVALSSSAAPWQAWWNFFAAGAFFLVGLGYLGNVSEKTFSIPWHEPRGYGFDSSTGFGHGFRFPVDRYYYPPLAEKLPEHAPRHYKRSDQRIEEDVYDRLIHTWGLNASEVRVSVNGGEVTLSGSVDSRRSRREVEEIADNVIGVIDIRNELRIESHQVPETGEKPKPIRAA